MQPVGKSSVLVSKWESFDVILLEALEKALIDTVGESASTAVKYYVDTSVIVHDPEMFQQLLRKVFSSSESASRLLEEKIQNTLQDFLVKKYSILINPAELKDKNFKHFILVCKRHFEVSKF